LLFGQQLSFREGTMNGDSLHRIVFFTVLYLSAFLLNFFWESGQGLLYIAHQEFAARVYVPMMVQMSLLDALSITGLYLLTSLVARSLVWRIDVRNLALFSLSGAVAAWSVEYVSVNLLHIWAYTSAMPMLFMVGLSPLLQLSLTGLLSIFVARGSAGFANE
jgi:hypothetical protein